MSVETKLYTSKQWSVEDIKEVIEKRFGVSVKYEFHDFSPEYIVLQFTLENGIHSRELGVHTQASIGGFPAIMLSLGSNEEGIAILRILAQTFGGLFQEEDGRDTFQEYPKPGDGNIDFIVKQAIKEDPSMGSDDRAIASYIAEEKWRSNSVWPKPIKLKGEQ